MCGIFGHIGDGAQTNVLTDMMTRNLDRGDRGWGVGAWSENESTIAKMASRPDAFISVWPATGYEMSMFHVRAPTNGQTDDASTFHPFATERFWFAHNGVLVDWKDNPLYQQWRREAFSGLLNSVKVDSVSILAGIEACARKGMGTLVGISTVMSQVEGQAACVLWDHAEETLYLWRVMSTLYYKVIDNVLYYSSTSILGGGEMLPEGKIYSIGTHWRARRTSRSDEEDSPWAWAPREFKYTTPYHET